MEDNQIKKGLVVRLKSGGPKMTVRKFHASDLWVCTWFAGDELKEGNFTPAQLDIVTE
jgi:uncharacterized protein YodC (DUF2158 family)